MESLKELTGIFCAVCILMGGLSMLPTGVLQKSAGYILSLVLLVSVVGAASGMDFDFSVTANSTAVSETGAEAVSEYQAEYICKRLLDEKGIKYEKIKAKATKNEEGGIIISKITIKGADRIAEATETVIKSGLTDRVETE